MIHLDYRDARAIYTQIMDGIRDQILAGILETGERLPSVRELAMALSINPNTIQRAYRELEMAGWIASVPGKGSFVAGVPLAREPAQPELLRQFDTLVKTLEMQGISRHTLIARLTQGGNDHA